MKEVARVAQAHAWHMKEDPPRLRMYAEIRYQIDEGFHTFAAFGWTAAEAFAEAEVEASRYLLIRSVQP